MRETEGSSERRRDHTKLPEYQVGRSKEEPQGAGSRPSKRRKFVLLGSGWGEGGNEWKTTLNEAKMTAEVVEEDAGSRLVRTQ